MNGEFFIWVSIDIPLLVRLGDGKIRTQGVVGLFGVFSDDGIGLLDHILQVLCYDFGEFKFCPSCVKY